MAKTADQVEDLVQETLLTAWLRQDRFRPRSHLRAWTFTIMRSSLSPSKRVTADPTEVGNAASGRRRIDPDR
ncbi:sigma factor [Methylobacterium sp. A52T]